MDQEKRQGSGKHQTAHAKPLVSIYCVPGVNVGDTRILKLRCLPSSIMQPGAEADMVGSECVYQLEAEDKGGRLHQDQVKRIIKTRLPGLPWWLRG